MFGVGGILGGVRESVRAGLGFGLPRVISLHNNTAPVASKFTAFQGARQARAERFSLVSSHLGGVSFASFVNFGSHSNLLTVLREGLSGFFFLKPSLSLKEQHFRLSA